MNPLGLVEHHCRVYMVWRLLCEKPRQEYLLFPIIASTSCVTCVIYSNKRKFTFSKFVVVVVDLKFIYLFIYLFLKKLKKF